MSSSVYNHRSLQPASGPSVVAPSPQGLGIAPPSAPPGPPQHRDHHASSHHSMQRLNDSFDLVRQEFELLASDVTLFRRERDEYESKVASQVSELNIIRQSLYELETQHSKIRQQYEDELAKLRAEIHAAARQSTGSSVTRDRERESAVLPPRPTSSSAPFDYYRDRERDKPLGDRDQRVDRERERERERERLSDSLRERERLIDNRDPKRIKVEPTRRPEYLTPVNTASMLPKMPPLTGSAGSSSLTSPKANWRDREGQRDHPPSSPKVGLSSGPLPTISLGRDSRDPVSDSRDHPSREMPLVPSRRPASPITSTSNRDPNPIILADLDPHTLPADLRTETSDWFCIFNPSLPPSALINPSKSRKNLEIGLMWTFSHATVVCCVQFSADGKFLATGCNRSAQIYDVKTGNKVCILTDDSTGNTGDLYIRSVRFSPDGRYLATGAEDKRIRIWDIARKKIVVTFAGHTQEIYALDFTPDGRSIVSGSGDKTARVWTLTPFVGLQGHSPVSPPPNPDDPRWCMILTISDSPNTPLPSTTPGGGSSSTNNDSPNSATEANSSSATDAGVTSVAVSPDGKFLAAGSLDCLVRIWDITTGVLLDRLQGHLNSVYSVVFTPDGKGVISGSLDRTMKYWDVSWLYSYSAAGSGSKPKEGGKCLMNFIGHKDYVLSVAVSHDSRWIVSGSKDRGVQFWDSRNAAVQCMLQGHKNSVISIALNPVGNLLATGSGDNLARIWRYTSTS